jgi:hypothetical protein
MLNRYFLLLIVVLLIPFSSVLASPVTDILNIYCSYDFKGYRIDPNRVKEIRDFYAWEEENRYEPGWDCFYIVSGFNIKMKSIKGNKAHAIIEYFILAEYCADNNLKKKKYTEVEAVTLAKIGDKWKLKNYVPFPRVSKEAAIAFFISCLKSLNKDDLEYEQKRMEKKRIINALKKL